MPRRAAAPAVAAVLAAALVLLAPGAVATYGAWTQINSVFAASRNTFSSVLLDNGKILVAGGFNQPGAVVYDVAARTAATVAGSLTSETQLQRPTATLLADGKTVLVAGGLTAPSSSAECTLYSTDDNSLATTGSMATARNSHRSVLLADGRVLTTGGFNGAQLSSCELYNADAGTWSSAASLLAGATFDHSLTRLGDGRVLIAGGSDLSATRSACALYTPVSAQQGSWTATGSLATARRGHDAQLLSNGRVLVIGGQTSSAFLSVTALCEIFDADGDSGAGAWTATGSLNTARSNLWQQTALFGDGRVLVAGGYDGSAALASAEMFDGTTWSTVTPMNTARYVGSLTAVGNEAFVYIGGSDTPGTSVEHYTIRSTPTPTSTATSTASATATSTASATATSTATPATATPTATPTSAAAGPRLSVPVAAAVALALAVLFA